MWLQLGELPRLSPDDCRRTIARWLERRSGLATTLRESTGPSTDPSEDYVVAYEAVFEPKDLEHARLAIFVTTDGYVEVGLETRERLARRLGVKNWRRPRGYGVGHQPGPMTVEQLTSLLDIVADAKFTLVAEVGLLGLGNVTAILRPEDATVLPDRSTSHWQWLTVSPKEVQHTSRVRVIRFAAW